MKAREYSEQRILAIPADVNEDGRVFYLNEDLGTADDEHNGLSGEIEMAFDNGYGAAMLEFKEYLEKNMTNYPDYMNGTDAYAFGMKEGYVVASNKIINELFKEEKK